MRAVYGERWQEAAQRSFREGRGHGGGDRHELRRDAHVLLTVLWDQWNPVFRNHLGPMERSLVGELREFRNRWAHQENFDFNNAYRILDSAERLLTAVGAPEAEVVRREKRELLRSEFSREARAAHQKSQLRRKMWREVSVYVVCCGVLNLAVFQAFGWDGLPFAISTLLIFGYLIVARLARPPAAIFGAHECTFCGKVIYGEPCPYCDRSARRSLPRNPTYEESAS